MRVHFSFPPLKMFLFVAFLGVVFAQPALQTVTEEKSVDAESSQPSTVKLSPSNSQAINQSVQPENQTPPASAELAEDVSPANHGLYMPATSQDKIQRAPEDASLSPAEMPVNVLILDTCIERDIQADSANQTTGQGRKVELQPGSPLVLTHKISVVPGPCTQSCEEQFSVLKKRLDKLETEVSTLRKKCGRSDSTHCPLELTQGTGDECPNDCSDQGRCHGGTCTCFVGFSGPDCSAAACPSVCRNKGVCVDGKCACQAGFTGPDCSVRSCPGSCSRRGRCVNGRCQCDAGFTGTDCAKKSCPSNCSNKGRCLQGKCVCKPGFTGPTCSWCETGLTGTECEKERTINIVKIETVTMKAVSGTDKVIGKILAKPKLDKPVFSQSEDNKNTETQKGKGPREKEDADKTKTDMVLKPGTGKTKINMESDVKLSPDKIKTKVESDIKPSTDKTKPKVESGVKPGTDKTIVKSDVKPDTEKTKTKVDSDVKPDTEKTKTKVKSEAKPGTDKTKTNVESDIKSGTDKTKTKVESDIKPGADKTKTKVESDAKPGTDKTKTNVESDIKSGTDKTKTKVESDAKPGTDKTKTNVESDIKPSTDKTKTKVESDAKPGTDKTKTKVESDIKSGTDKTKTKVEPDVKPGTDKTKTNVESDIKPSTDKTKTKVKSDVKLGTDKTKTNVESDAKPDTGKTKTNVESDIKSDTADLISGAGNVHTQEESDVKSNASKANTNTDFKTASKTHSKADSSLKSNVSTTVSKPDLDMKLSTGTAKSHSDMKTRKQVDQKSHSATTLTKADSDQRSETAKKEKTTESELKRGASKVESKEDSHHKSDTVKTQTKVDLDVKLDTIKTQTKVDSGQKSDTAKTETNIDLDQKSGVAKMQKKADSDQISGTAKIQIKPDSDHKSGTATDKTVDLDLKTENAKSDLKLDSDLKSETAKSHLKADSDLKSSTAKSQTKENDGVESKPGNKTTIIRKLTTFGPIHTNSTKHGQAEKGVDQTSVKQTDNKKEDLAKTTTSDSKYETKMDPKTHHKTGEKIAVDAEINSINRTHTKPHKVILQNVNQSSDFVHQTNATYKDKAVSVKQTNRSEPGKKSIDQILTVKNASKIIEKKLIQNDKISHGSVTKTQTDGKPSEPHSNATVHKEIHGSNFQKTAFIHSTGSSSSTLVAGNKTTKNIVKTGPVTHGGSSTNISKGVIAETQNIKNKVIKTDTQSVQPRLNQNELVRNWTKPNLKVPQHRPHPPRSTAQPTQPSLSQDKKGAIGHMGGDGNSAVSRRNKAMQETSITTQLDKPTKIRFHTEARKDNSSSSKTKEHHSRIIYNDTTSSSVNSSSDVIRPAGPAVDTNRTISSSSTRKFESDLTSVRVHNITSRGFSLAWEALQGLFKQFIVTQREYGLEKADENEVEDDDEEGDREEIQRKTGESSSQKDGGKEDIQKNAVGKSKIISTRKDGNSSTAASGKAHDGTRFQTDGSYTRKVTQVVSGATRSVTIRKLRPQTQYSLSLYGKSPGLRSKIHRLIVTTAPEPPTELLFTNVTDSSLSVCWTKPKSPVTGFKVTYANTENGKPVSVTVDSQHSSAALSKLSPGSSYEVTITSLKGLDESDPITGLVVTVPDSPTGLQVTNITHSKAVMQWTPTLAKVDRYVVAYGSARAPSVTVIVSGKAAELQLQGLQEATVYTVTVTSQVDSLQSAAINTTFTTAAHRGSRWEGQLGLTANQVSAHSAVLSWRSPGPKVTGYKLLYQIEGEDIKEISLNSSVTQHKLSGLHPMSKYTVQLQAPRGGHYSTLISTEFRTGSLRFPLPRDCSQVMLNGLQQSGKTQIYPRAKQEQATWVYCDMETDGGGWTVFQRRMNGKTNFFRSWQDYSKGFGNMSEEFWLGNELLHTLTSLAPTELQVDLRAGAESAFARYSSFSIESQRRHYTIMLSGYSGTAGDSMKYHNGQPFSTRDKEPKAVLSGCALAYRGGWWYKDCHEANLNGLYKTNTNHQGVIWMAWKGRDFSIPFTEMKIRPLAFMTQNQG